MRPWTLRRGATLGGILASLLVVLALTSSAGADLLDDATDPVVTVDRPDSGVVSGDAEVSWQTVDINPDTVRIEVRPTGGTNWTTIAEDVPDSALGGRYAWDT